MPERPQRVRYAVVGLGYISQIAVLPAFKNAQENSELALLVSDDEKKRKVLSRKYRVAKSCNYEQFGDCLQRKEVDAVYIALPNNMHRAYTEAAAQAGVHVLCEKPMAVDEAECEAMIAAAEQAKIKLMIAYRLHFEKGNLSVLKMIEDGQIGEPRIFRSAFSQQVAQGNSRLKGQLGQGPLHDLGVYCINAARAIFRAEPDEVFAYTATAGDERFAEVPEMYSVLMRFPSDRLATFTCSFGAADRSAYEVVGTNGSIRMDPAYEMVGNLKCELTIDGKTKKFTYRQRDQFGPELVYFSDCVLNDKEPEPDGTEGLADVRVVSALIESAKKGHPVTIKKVEKSQRPTIEQEIQKPAIKKPPLVRAAAPSR